MKKMNVFYLKIMDENKAVNVNRNEVIQLLNCICKINIDIYNSVTSSLKLVLRPFLIQY